MVLKKNNVCGWIGIGTGWICPFAGLILGIIALARYEKSKWIGIVSIIESIIFAILWFFIYNVNI